REFPGLWPYFKEDLAKGRGASNVQSEVAALMQGPLDLVCDPILFAGAGISYCIEPLLQLSNDIMYEVDENFKAQEESFDELVELLTACKDFKISGKITDNFKGICTNNNPLIKNFDLFLDEIELCCQDFMAGVDLRYKNMS